MSCVIEESRTYTVKFKGCRLKRGRTPLETDEVETLMKSAEPYVRTAVSRGPGCKPKRHA